MTEYRITFTNKETGRQGSDTFNGPTESAAKKEFREVYRHAEYTIDSVEPIKENVMATKQQERDALEQIKAIIGTLGDSSYVGTALAGCLEIADQNIEYDFGDSMKERAESAQKKYEELKTEFTKMQQMLQNAQEAAQTAIDALAEERANRLTTDELVECEALANARKTAYEQERDSMAAAIVEHAETPESPEFRLATSNHRGAKRAAEKFDKLADRIVEVIKTRG